MIPAEAAHDTVAALGEVGMLQFKDLNAERTAFQRTYANEVRQRSPAALWCKSVALIPALCDLISRTACSRALPACLPACLPSWLA
jgi:hypothetical protein